MEYIDSFTFRKKQTNQQQPNENGRKKISIQKNQNTIKTGKTEK